MIVCKKQEFLNKIKYKFPKKWKLNKELENLWFCLSTVNVKIGKCLFTLENGIEKFYSDDGQCMCILSQEYAKNQLHLNVGNICIKFEYLATGTSYMLFENLENLTIEEFYRKIMS